MVEVGRQLERQAKVSEIQCKEALRSAKGFESMTTYGCCVAHASRTTSNSSTEWATKDPLGRPMGEAEWVEWARRAPLDAKVGWQEVKRRG